MLRFAASLSVKYGVNGESYETNAVWDRMWKQIGNGVDGLLAKAIGDTILAAALEDLRRQPQVGGGGDGLGAEGEAAMGSDD